ncbi:MAG: hypothetical protein ACI9G1_003308 [Pirellulaceae bacterium]|jgi:hypothetical protein
MYTFQKIKSLVALVMTIVFVVSAANQVSAGEVAANPTEKSEKDRAVKLSNGNIVLTAPKQWERVKPRNRIIEHEFSAPKQKEDLIDGRITLMGAAGGVERNIERWIGQFRQADGGGAKPKREELKIAGQKVHVVELSGTFKDQRGPFAPATMQEGYKMFGAIIVTEKLGTYFVKFYGPQETVSANEEAFRSFLKTMKVTVPPAPKTPPKENTEK